MAAEVTRPTGPLVMGPSAVRSRRQRQRPARPQCRVSEVDPHHDTAQCRTADLGETGLGEYAFGPDVELLQDHVFRGHGVALDGAGAALAGEVHRGTRECPTDAALPEARAGDEAGHRPDAVVGLVLGATLPGDAVGAHQARVAGAWFDRTPADRLAVEVRDETARGAGLRMAAVGLLTQPVGAFLVGKGGEELPRPQLVPLALAPGRLAPCAEDRLQVFPARLVGGHDGDRRFRCRHAHDSAGRADGLAVRTLWCAQPARSG